jgi:hypothetical protein
LGACDALYTPSPLGPLIEVAESSGGEVEALVHGDALSQGDSPGDVPPASPAAPDSGELLLVNRNGSFTELVDELDLPTSLDFVGDTAFITTLNGEVWKITNVSKFLNR